MRCSTGSPGIWPWPAARRGAQVAQGLVRGAARLARGDTRGALAEAAGGLAAPVVSAVHQFSLLGADVYQAATSLTAQGA